MKNILLIWILILFISRNFFSTDTSILFFRKKFKQQVRFHFNQQQSSVSPMPGNLWTHFQCDPKVSPYIGVGFGCYCPGTWCTNNGDCCSQMCYKKTCY